MLPVRTAVRNGRAHMWVAAVACDPCPVDRRTRVWALVGVCAYGLAVVGVLASPVSPGDAVAAATAFLRDGLGWSAVRQGWVEFAANIALFVPLGFLLTVLLRRWWAAVALGSALSIAAEVGQMLLPGRLASPRDVLANLTGALVGALVAVLIDRVASAHGRRSGGRDRTATPPPGPSPSHDA